MADAVDSEASTHSQSHLTEERLAAATREGLRVVAIASAGMLVVAAAELAIFAVTQSAGLLADALHHLSDVLVTATIGVAFLLARRPLTTRFTYGLHRIEDLAGAFIALVITISGAAAGVNAYQRLVTHAHPTQIGWGILAALAAFAANEAIAEYKLRAGRRLDSAALVTEGRHARADGLASLVAAAGLALAGLGVPAADAIAGLVIAVAILYLLLDVRRDVLSSLLDTVDPAVIAQVREQALAVSGVAQVEDVRARWAGQQLYVALNLAADGAIPLAEAHAMVERVRQEVLAHVAGAAMVDVHVDPLGPPEGMDPTAAARVDRGEEQAQGLAHELVGDSQPPA
jgi:cation diffusion facilitator family transporter